MVFYGTSSSRLKNGRLNNVTCPNCNEHTSMNYSVFGKYAYIYWIPIFPTGKENILECTNCKRTFKLKVLSNQIKQKFELEKHRGIPLKHFSGLAIIALLICWLSYTNAQEEKNTEIYINSPQIGDVYHIQGSTSSYYSSAKVTDIKADSVFVIFNSFEVDRKSGVDELDIKKNYLVENKEGYTAQDLLKLYEDNIIYKVDRD